MDVHASIMACHLLRCGCSTILITTVVSSYSLGGREKGGNFLNFTTRYIGWSRSS